LARLICKGLALVIEKVDSAASGRHRKDCPRTYPSFGFF
jgi:hypothetical protein